MPIYEYECGTCGHRLEVLQNISEAPLVECPTCHKMDLKKLISAAGFQLKGTGWYATDFRNKTKSDATTSKNDSGKTDSSSSSDTKGSSS